MNAVFRAASLAALLALTILPAVLAPAHAAEPAPLHVVATFSVLGDMVKEVGGDDVAVKALVGPGGDAHVFQPTPDDARAVAQADIVFVNGLGLEGWMDRLTQAAGGKAKIVVASKGVTPRQMMEEGEHGGAPTKVTDPHAWQNVSNGRIYVRNIEAALVAARSSQAAQFHERAARYGAELGALDQEVRSAVAEVPEKQRKVITSHDAFGYFGAAYGVTFLAPVGLSTEAEPTAADVGKLIGQIREEGIKDVFIENMTDPRLIERIGKDTGAELGGELYSDALSPADGPAPTYIAMFRNNVPKLVAAMKRNAGK